MDLKKLGIDENMFEELQALFKMFDLDCDGVLSLAEFQRVLSLLGHSGMIHLLKGRVRPIYLFANIFDRYAYIGKQDTYRNQLLEYWLYQYFPNIHQNTRISSKNFKANLF